MPGLCLKSDFNRERWAASLETVVDYSCEYFVCSMERKTEVEDGTTTGMGKSACGGRQSAMGLEKVYFVVRRVVSQFI